MQKSKLSSEARSCFAGQFKIKKVRTGIKMDKKRGQMLVVVLLVMIVGLTIGLFLTSRTTTDVALTTKITESSRAFNAAEAGIEEAIRSITAVPAGSPVPFASGLTYTVTAADLGTIGMYPATVQEPVDINEAFTLWLVPHDEATGDLVYTYSISPGPIGLWHLDETSGSGAYLKDSSGNFTVPTGTGADGACSVTSGSTNINSASCVGRANGDAVNFTVTTSVAALQNQVTVSSTPTGLLAGDEILIINVLGAAAGTYETAYINSISTNTLTLDRNLTNAYDGTTQKIMVQRVPNYTTVSISSGATLTASAYTCASGKGGVIFFRANGTVTVDGTIDGNALGYPGDGGGGNNIGYQGESYTVCTGNSAASRDANNGGGGGGGTGGGVSPWGGAGGAGGGYGAAGSAGSNSGADLGGLAGGTYGTTSLSSLMLGSGGGGGGNEMNGPAGSGGSGGGIVAIHANTLTVNATGFIKSDGGAGTCKNNTAGAGGGGSGGSVLIKTYTTTLGTNLVTASAGAGSTTLCSGVGGGGNGGNGGVGRVRVESTNPISGTTNPSASTLTPNHGTPTGTTVVDGFYGKARSFNGSSDHIVINNSQFIHRTNNFSYEWWTKWNATPVPVQSYFENGTWGNSLIIRQESASAINIYAMSTSYGAFSFTPAVGTWYHLAVVRNGNTLYLYVNGVQTGSMSFTADVNPSANLWIGASQHAPTQTINAVMDEVRIYNYARTADQIIEDMNNANGYYTSNTIDICYTENTIAPALGVTLFYVDKNDGGLIKSSYAAYDVNSGSRGTGFKPADLTMTQCGGIGGGYKYHRQVNFSTDFNITLANSVLLALRIRPLYAAASIAVTPAGGVGGVLPKQGNDITSTGVSGIATRRINVLEPYEFLPPFMDYVLYSTGNSPLAK